MRGITVTLHVKTASSTDDFGAPVYTDSTTKVDNVLVGEPTSEQVLEDLNLHGKHLAYVLAIPKGDANTWTDTEVEFFGQTFKTYGEPTQGIDHLIPLAWNKKVKVERYG